MSAPRLEASLAVALMTEQATPSAAWVHVLPVGTFYGRDGRGPYTVAHAEAIIDATRALAGKRQLVIDYEHQTLRSEKNGAPAPAAGWISGLKQRPNGIWALVEWTEAAAVHIAKREYRYLSPVFYHTPDGVVTAILNAALTNAPNLDQLTALARTEIVPMDELTTKLREVAALLGLPDTADRATILKRLQDIGKLASDVATLTGDTTIAPQSTAPDPTKYVPIGDFERAVADANKLRQGVTLTAATQRVDGAIREGKLAPFLKDWALGLCTVNVPAFDGFLDRVGPAFHNLFVSQMPAGPGRREKPGERLSDDEEAIRQRMGLTVEQFSKGRIGADKD